MGRPATGIGTPVQVRLNADQLALLDRWIAVSGEGLTRPEAMRRLMVLALQQAGIG